MFTRKLFYNLTTDFRVRGKCFGASADVVSTNETNERIAEKTNAANAQINKETNDANLRIAAETNAANIQMNAANNYLQQKLQDEMNAFNYRMWQENNEYNSPAAQLQRAREAGINPNSALGNSVASSPVQQVSVPNTTPGYAEMASVMPYEYQSWQAQASRRDTMDLLTEFGKQVNTAFDTQAKVLANENQSYVNDFAPAMLASGLIGSNLRNDLSKSNIKNVNQDTLLKMRQAQGISQQISESKQKVLNMQMEWNGLSEDVYRKQIDNSFAFVMNEANLAQIKSETNLNEANIKYIGVKMKCESMLSYAQANNLNWQSEVYKVEARARQEFLDSGGTQAQINSMNAATNLYTSQKTGQDLTNGITEGIADAEIRKANASADAADYQNSTFFRALDAADKIGSTIQKVGTGVGSVVNAFKPGVNFNGYNNGYISTPTGRNPYE